MNGVCSLREATYCSNPFEIFSLIWCFFLMTIFPRTFFPKTILPSDIPSKWYYFLSDFFFLRQSFLVTFLPSDIISYQTFFPNDIISYDIFSKWYFFLCHFFLVTLFPNFLKIWMNDSMIWFQTMKHEENWIELSIWDIFHII